MQPRPTIKRHLVTPIHVESADLAALKRRSVQSLHFFLILASNIEWTYNPYVKFMDEPLRNDMDLKQLRYLSAIAHWGSFTAAAESLFIAQPALSIQMAKLEGEVGQQLLERGKYGARLTEFGREFLTRAEKILRDVEELESLGRRDSPKQVTVRIGVPPLVSKLLTVPLLTEVRQHHPWISLSVHEAMSGTLRNQLHRGELDLAVLHNVSPAEFPNAVTLLSEKLIVCARVDAKLGKGKTLSIKRIDSVPIISTTTANASRILLEEIAQAAGISLNIVAEVDSLERMSELVLQGLGCVVFSPLGKAAWGSEQDRFRSWELTGVTEMWRTTLVNSPRKRPSHGAQTIATLVTSLSFVLQKQTLT
jgi:LysR family transcriptional regulator, nitrogen assimilation regulatory protein